MQDILHKIEQFESLPHRLQYFICHDAGSRARSRFLLAAHMPLCHNHSMAADKETNDSAKHMAGLFLEGLKKRYPQISHHLNFENPWQLLVATILSAQCQDMRVNQTTPEFFKLWPSPLALASASQEEIESVIRSLGFFRNKAKNLLACAKKLVKEHSGAVPDNMNDLLGLPGVARKTANVVLSGAFDKPCGIAVDTHVKRISMRLGFTGNSDPDKIEQDLLALFPQPEWKDLNLRMVSFGRDVCDAKKPKCTQCEFSGICPFAVAAGKKQP